MKSNLNEKQKEAVSLDFGPALILAGPGSGKTTVILERIKYLIFHFNISPKNILVITFTKSAALEMSTRAETILEHLEEKPFFGTFHSYFYSVLKRSANYRNFSILSGKQKFKNLENLLKTNYPKYPISNHFMGEILACISKHKNALLIDKELKKLEIPTEEFLTLQKTYDYFNREQQLMDYDDILLFAKELLEENPFILETLQEEIKYILVDEFQDVNALQYELVALLAGEKGNLFVVGDDDQSIYRFRGAREENLRRFERKFTPVKVILNINYRCPKEVVRVASKLIAHNEMRFPKEIVSQKSINGRVLCKQFVSKDRERRFVVESIQTISERNSGKTTAVLCRTNSQLGILAEALKKEKIRFYIKEKVVPFYELKCIKPIIGYLMFASGKDRSRRVLFSFLNKPIRYIERELFVNWEGKEKSLSEIPSDNPVTRRQLYNLEEALKKISKLSPAVAISYILKVIGYEAFVIESCVTKEELEQVKSALEELKERAKMYDTIKEWMEYIKWEEGAEATELEENRITKETIFLYTFHGAKGLEFDTVFIPHLNEGSVPYGKNLLKEELEEERRMFYVALTRSRENVQITYVESGTKKDTASRFLKECGLTVSKDSYG